MADDAITRGGIGVLGSLFYICGGTPIKVYLTLPFQAPYFTRQYQARVAKEYESQLSLTADSPVVPTPHIELWLYFPFFGTF